jgi:hypothetical protein
MEDASQVHGGRAEQQLGDASSLAVEQASLLVAIGSPVVDECERGWILLLPDLLGRPTRHSARDQGPDRPEIRQTLRPARPAW